MKKLLAGPSAASLKLRISIGEKSLGKVSNKTTTWEKLITKMSEPLVDVRHSLPEYLRLPREKQDRLKNVGFFVAGHCDGGIRRVGHVKQRHLITLDVDECNPGHVFDLEAGMSDISEYEFFVYSTRKHTSEKPRLRIVIPLASPCDADAYHALSRIVAEKFDVSMESVDPISYRATQLMYWPSVCRDAEFFTLHNEGSVLDPTQTLEDFGDWRDHTKLPRSSRDASQHVVAGKKPEDPETKDGLVGAFCRVYNVVDAIETFLSDVYVDPIETPQGLRYTFARGTTSYGAIVYDEGKFLYSNHMHDPASGHSQNAFDLVRIHKFGELDEKAREDTPPLSLPSAKAMVDSLKSDRTLAKELLDSNYDLDRSAREAVTDDGVFGPLDDEDEFDRTTPRGSEDVTEENWLDHLDLSSEGLIKPSMHNMTLILMFDPRLSGCVRKNRFSGRKVYCRELGIREFGCAPLPVFDLVNGSDWTDSHSRFVKLMLESPRGKGKPGYGLLPTKDNLHDAIDLAADRQHFHPIKDYLSTLEWDGVPRMDSVFVEYLGAEDTAYHRAVCRLTLLAAVTRIFEPGHKFDFMPVLEGAQGKRKSSFVKALSKGLWFREMGDINDKNRSIEGMAGAWILEFAELHQFNRSEVTRIKEFLAATGETSRLAFERNPRTFLRQCVFIGTTNNREYLKDDTGNRRFWPVDCRTETIDVDKLSRNIDQIWAEALSVYQAMRVEQPYGDLPLYLSDEETEKEARAVQASRKIVFNDELLADQIETWLNKKITLVESKGVCVEQDDGIWDESEAIHLRIVTCSAEIYEKVLGCDRKRIATDKTAQYEIARAMQLVPGWFRCSRQGNYGSYGKQRVLYRRIGFSEDDEL